MPTKRRRTTQKRKRNGKTTRKAVKLDANTRRALLQLARNVKKNSPIIRRRLRAAGVKPNPAMVFVTALNLEALDRLAKE
jgi:phenylacetate-coenzyme A ligase PaaK-like adenylate-forming protein